MQFLARSPITRFSVFHSSRVHHISQHLRCFSSDNESLAEFTDSLDYPDTANISKNPIVQQLWSARRKAKHRSGRDKESSDSSQGKAPKASHVAVSYPFSTDIMLRETYRNPWGQMRLGRILEDLDALAGNVAFFHVDQGQEVEKQPVIVTASVDRICLEQPPPPMTVNQQLSGQVTWTGTSSMEICMQFLSEGSKDAWLTAFVTFVTLDPKTHKATKVPALLPESDAEHAAFRAGADRAALRKEQRMHHKKQSDCNKKDSKITFASAARVDELAAKLMQQAGPLLNMPSLADPHSILMHATRMQNAMIAQPQLQNMHNRIFGGFLMRRAFELAFATAYVFGGARPIFLEVDEVSFQSPVDVGDLLVFNSCVLYTDRGRLGNKYKSSSSNNETAGDHEHPLVHVEVEAWVTIPENVSARLSNQFHFTFACVSEKAVRTVLPANIDEARRMASRMEANREQESGGSQKSS